MTRDFLPVTKEDMQIERKELLLEVERRFLEKVAFQEFTKRFDDKFDVMSKTLDKVVENQEHIKDYIIQNAYGYGLFTGGFGIHHGGNKMGAITIPISAGNTQRQLDTMIDFQSDVLTCTPSYAMYLGESREKAGISLEDINLKAGIHGAERAEFYGRNAGLFPDGNLEFRLRD